MINSIRRCVACDDIWPGPISSRSFDLDLENRVRSVASTVLYGFFVYLAQMITISRGCVTCYVLFRIWKIKFLANILSFSTLTLKKKSTVLNGFFPYLAQMITIMRGCVAYNDLWLWPISSRSFGLGLENCVRSVASTVLDGFFPYLVQMITSMRRCVACDDHWPWPISSRSFDLYLENRVHSVTGGDRARVARVTIVKMATSSTLASVSTSPFTALPSCIQVLMIYRIDEGHAWEYRRSISYSSVKYPLHRPPKQCASCDDCCT